MIGTLMFELRDQFDLCEVPAQAQAITLKALPLPVVRSIQSKIDGDRHFAAPQACQHLFFTNMLSEPLIIVVIIGFFEACTLSLTNVPLHFPVAPGQRSGSRKVPLMLKVAKNER